MNPQKTDILIIGSGLAGASAAIAATEQGKNVTIITKTKTFPKVCLEVMFDYTHFLFKHRTSFNDFKVITENETEQIFYYETRVFNWFLWSPIRRLISIKRLFPEKYFSQEIPWEFLEFLSNHVFSGARG